MGTGVTMIVGAGAVLDFEHKGVFPSVGSISEEVLKISTQKVDGTEMLLIKDLSTKPPSPQTSASSKTLPIASTSPSKSKTPPPIHSSSKSKSKALKGWSYPKASILRHPVEINEMR